MYPASLRNGIQTSALPALTSYVNGYTFLSNKSSTASSEYADFMTTACLYGSFKSYDGNGVCMPWNCVDQTEANLGGRGTCATFTSSYCFPSSFARSGWNRN